MRNPAAVTSAADLIYQGNVESFVKHARRCLTLMPLLLLLCSTLTVHAQGVITFSQPTTGGGWNGTDQMQGWEFIPQVDVSVTELGIYDGQIPTGFNQPHSVAIWTDNGDLVTSASIPSGTSAPLQNNFRYADVAPTTLLAGQTYVIGAFYPTPVSDYTVLWERNGLGNVVFVDPRLDFVAYRSGPSPGGISFPATRDTGYVGGFGPSFVIGIPEPGAVAFLGVALAVGMLRAGRWRKRAVKAIH